MPMRYLSFIIPMEYGGTKFQSDQWSIPGSLHFSYSLDVIITNKFQHLITDREALWKLDSTLRPLALSRSATLTYERTREMERYDDTHLQLIRSVIRNAQGNWEQEILPLAICNVSVSKISAYSLIRGESEHVKFEKSARANQVKMRLKNYLIQETI